MTDEDQAARDENMPPSDIDETIKPVDEDTATSDSEIPEGIDEKQKVLNQLAFEKREEKRHRIALEEEVAQLKAQIPKPAKQEEVAPKLEDFDFDEHKHNDALIDFKVNQKAKELAVEQEEQQAAQNQQALQKSFNDNVRKLSETTPDYEESIGKLPVFPGDTLNAIMQSENGPQLAYYLGKHLDIADKIASENPMMAAMSLGRISARLESVKPEPKQSAAPEPIEPVNTSGSLNKSQEDMTMDEIYNM